MNTIRQVDGVWRCVFCDRPSPDQANPHTGDCACPGDGLGDMTARALAAVGITKDRAQRLANAVGIADCGCPERQRAMNLLGYRLGIGTPPPADSGASAPKSG